MHYFQLFYGDKVKKGPHGKVIPASEFSTLMDAKAILEKTREEAEQYRSDIAKEGEELKERAQQEGFEQGSEAWSEQLALLEKEIQTVEEKLKKLVIPVALEAAKKIVGREMTLDPNTVADIVANNLKAVAGHRRVVVYCHKDDLEALEKNREELKGGFERLESFSIQARDDVDPGGCIIETEAGIINAQLDLQWRALEAAFQAMMQK